MSTKYEEALGSLKKIGDSFIWPDIGARNGLINGAKLRGVRISTHKCMRGLYVTRIPINESGRPSKYPWGELKNIGDSFVWPNINDRNSILRSSIYKFMRVKSKSIKEKGVCVGVLITRVK